MGSRINVISTVDQGSTFSFQLSLPISNRQRTTEIIQDSIVDISLLAGKTILIVDDNRINRKIASLALDSSKANILLAENGRDAIEKFKNKSYRYII